ncbi:MAG TPA: chemotaxis protein CheA [Spirochaetota bacterium]|nr:chemotaxis protein CheA [Spirochaetota bacterium]HPS85566.1 chemotaxis protein CheA [Spirochaetota bacterium]
MADINNEKNFKNVYFTESRELLDSMEMSLLALEKESTNEDSINSIFRTAHTIKGNSGMFGFGRIGEFAHVLENLLVCTRNKTVIITPELIGLLLECHDFIQILLDHYESKEELPLDDESESLFAVLKERLNNFIPDAEKTEKLKEKELETVIELESSCADPDEMLVCNDCWHISLRFGRNVFKDGLDPYSFISYLGEKGEIQNIKTVYEDMPYGSEMKADLCYLGFEMDFRSSINKKEIEDVFDFVMNDCNIRILPPKSSIAEYVKLIEELPETPMKIGDMLREIGSLTDTELEIALELQAELSAEKKKPPEDLLVGKILVEEKMIQKHILDAALSKQENVKKREASDRKLIRIDAEKLDHLINLIGELVITGSNVKQISESDDKLGIAKAVTDMSKLIEEIRDSTMGIRMVPIGETFSRFERVVRDLSREKGKSVELKIIGGETELDKTLIDKLSDPLIHLIRNSVDHGIGTPAEREKAGKPAAGILTLNAYHETGSIVIEVSDDGDGLNRESILNKAVEQGFAKPDQAYTDDELYKFIFQPGFSTAKEVSNISGRGVGMDVVKKNIESLRGNVFLESEKGLGTTVRIHLPLTLAIIDGFMVRIADSYYVLALDMVTECTEIRKEELDSKEGGNYINLRGEVLPFMKMREFFRESGEEPEKPKVVVVEYSRKKIGLVVDDLIGEFQTVIKPMGKIFSKLQWLSGSTILGTGEVAYILDVPKLIKNAHELE